MKTEHAPTSPSHEPKQVGLRQRVGMAASAVALAASSIAFGGAILRNLSQNTNTPPAPQGGVTIAPDTARYFQAQPTMVPPPGYIMDTGMPGSKAPMSHDPTVGAQSGRQTPTHVRRLLFINIDPVIEPTGTQTLTQTATQRYGWNDPNKLIEASMLNLYAVTGGAVSDTIVASGTLDIYPPKKDGFQYTDDTFTACIEDTNSCHTPDAADMATLYRHPQIDVCGRAQRDEIDAVAIIAPIYSGLPETQLVVGNVRDAIWLNSPAVVLPECEKEVVPVFMYVPNGGVDFMRHNDAHAIEALMWRRFTTWNGQPAPGVSAPAQGSDHTWDRFTRTYTATSRPIPDVSGCGNVHGFVNSSKDYDYGNRTTAQSNCEIFNNPALPITFTRPVSAATWGSTMAGFYDRWWYPNIPNQPGCDAYGVSNQWMTYLASPSKVLTETTACPVAPTPTPPKFHVNVPLVMREQRSAQPRQPTPTPAPSPDALFFPLAAAGFEKRERDRKGELRSHNAHVKRTKSQGRIY